MKSINVVGSALFALAAMTAALAQTPDQPKAIAAARCRYAQANACPALESPSNKPVLLAQYGRRHLPPPPRRPPMAYSRPSYPVWDAQVAGRHAIIGAVIGFAIGAAAGAKQNGRTALSVGGVSAGIGALIGFGMPTLPSRYDRWRYDRWPDDDDDDAAKRPPRKAPDKKADTLASLPKAAEPVPDRPVTPSR